VKLDGSRAGIGLSQLPSQFRPEGGEGTAEAIPAVDAARPACVEIKGDKARGRDHVGPQRRMPGYLAPEYGHRIKTLVDQDAPEVEDRRRGQLDGSGNRSSLTCRHDSLRLGVNRRGKLGLTHFPCRFAGQLIAGHAI